mgnify:CR=1 FL=1
MRGRNIALILLAAAFFGCGTMQTGQQMLISEEGQKSWITDPGKFDTENAKAFVGLSSRIKTETGARKDALKDARKQILDSMGVNIKRKIREVITSAGLSSNIIDPGVVMDDMSSFVSEGFVKARAKKYYVQKWKEKTPKGWQWYYKVYVLVLMPNKSFDEGIKQSLKQKAAEIKDEQAKRNIERAVDLMKKMETGDW